MNFIKCTVADGGALLQAKTFSLPSPMAARETLKARAGKQLIVGVRPENVVAQGRPTRGTTAPLELTADLVETLGDEVVVHGRQGEDTVTFKMDPHRPPEMGDKVPVVVEIERLHLFDAETTKRIAD